MSMFIFSDDIARRVIGTAITETLTLLGQEFYRHCSQHENFDCSEKIQEYLNELSNLLSESNKLKASQPKTKEKTDAQSEVKF